MQALVKWSVALEAEEGAERISHSKLYFLYPHVIRVVWEYNLAEDGRRRFFTTPRVTRYCQG
jgi:hypothetical protein